jgi:hypothetical protein
MNYPVAHRKAVFLSEHCRRVFGQQYSPIVKRKDIRNAIRHEAISVADVPELELVDILCYLITNGIFHAEASIQLQFPDLYEPSFVGTHQQEAMEDVSADQRLSGIVYSYVWLERYDCLVVLS